MNKYYVYVIKFKPTDQIYIGSRYGRKSDPFQLLNPNHQRPYYTSSKRIHHLIKTHGLESFEILRLRVFNDPKFCLDFEYRLTRFLFNKLGKERLLNNSITWFKRFYTKGERIWINNGIVNKLIYESEIIPEGWVRGFFSARWSKHTKKQPFKRKLSKENHTVYYEPQTGAFYCGYNLKLGKKAIVNSYEQYGLKAVPKEFRIRLFNGVRNITWDSRIPIPSNCSIGYVLSEKQLRAIRERESVSTVRRTEKFRFKNVKDNTEVEMCINEFHKLTNISYPCIRFLTDGHKKVIKGWTIFDTKINKWRNEIPRGKGNWWELVDSQPPF